MRRAASGGVSASAASRHIQSRSEGTRVCRALCSTRQARGTFLRRRSQRARHGCTSPLDAQTAGLVLLMGAPLPSAVRRPEQAISGALPLGCGQMMGLRMLTQREMTRVIVPLDEVVSGQDIQERHERDDHRNTPSEPRDEAHAPAAEDEIDPDQHHGDWMQDAEQELDHFLEHGGSVAHARRGSRSGRRGRIS